MSSLSGLALANFLEHQLPTTHYMGVSKNRGVPQNGWFIMEHPIEMDQFGGTTIFGNIHISEVGIMYVCVVFFFFERG